MTEAVEPPLTGFGARIPQPIRYVAVGGFNTVFSLGVFAAFDHYLPYLVALLITHVITVLEAFTLQRYVVFYVRGNVAIDLARFESVQIGQFLVNLGALPLMVTVIGLPAVLAQGIYLVVSAVATFFLNKHFSFRR